MAIWHGTGYEVGHLGIQGEPFWAWREAGVAPSVVKTRRCWDGAWRNRVTIGEESIRPSDISHTVSRRTTPSPAITNHCCSRPKVEWKMSGDGSEKFRRGNWPMSSARTFCKGCASTDRRASSPSTVKHVFRRMMAAWEGERKEKRYGRETRHDSREPYHCCDRAEVAAVMYHNHT